MNEKIKTAIKAFYKTTNFYQFDKVVSIDIMNLDGVDYIDAKVRVTRHQDATIDKIFEPIQNILKYLEV